MCVESFEVYAAEGVDAWASGVDEVHDGES